MERNEMELKIKQLSKELIIPIDIKYIKKLDLEKVTNLLSILEQKKKEWKSICN